MLAALLYDTLSIGAKRNLLFQIRHHRNGGRKKPKERHRKGIERRSSSGPDKRELESTIQQTRIQHREKMHKRRSDRVE